jgi:hypothetical protein
MNAIRAKDAEFAFIVATEVHKATATLAAAGQRHLVDGSGSLLILIFDQHQGLARHGRREAQIRKLNDLAIDGLRRRGN